MDFRAEPFDHAGVILLPAFLKQALLREGFLRVEDDDLRLAATAGLEHMRHHGDALIGAWRAAIWVGRRDHDNQAAIGHGGKRLCSNCVCGPAFQAWGMISSASRLQPGTLSYFRSMPGERIKRS